MFSFYIEIHIICIKTHIIECLCNVMKFAYVINYNAIIMKFYTYRLTCKRSEFEDDSR